MANFLKYNLYSSSSTNRRLYSVIVSTVTIIVGLAVLGMFGMYTISGMRSFVGAEGLWSKSQKIAVSHLLRYASNRDRQEYDAFNKYLAVPLGHKQARLELEKLDPNMEVAHRGLILGGNHPLDVAGMANLFRWFRNFEYIDRAINIWARADELIESLTIQAEHLHQQIVAGDQSNTMEIEATVAKIIDIDRQLTTLEDEFSFSLGEASRWAKGLLGKLFTLPVPLFAVGLHC
jgi:hypothetical protein